MYRPFQTPDGYWYVAWVRENGDHDESPRGQFSKEGAEREAARRNVESPEPPKSVTYWVPTLRRGAPSNASGMRGNGTAYWTRGEALKHEHWANQAAWASAKQVSVSDYGTSAACEEAAWAACGGPVIAEALADHDERALRSLKHLRGKRWACAVLETLGVEKGMDR